GRREDRPADQRCVDGGVVRDDHVEGRQFAAVPLRRGTGHDGRGRGLDAGRWRRGVQQRLQPRGARRRRAVGQSARRRGCRVDLRRTRSGRGRLRLHALALPGDVLMGVFLVRQVDRDSGVEIVRFAARNFLANEGISHVLRQLFPPYDAAVAFQIGVTGATTGYPNSRPNSGGGAAFGPTLTFAQCTAAGANEGGAYTDAMRSSFGYSRQAVAFTASLEADGGALVSPEVEFPNN